MAELGRMVGAAHAGPPAAADLVDATERTGLRGRADAVVSPGTPEEVAAVMAWCYAHDVALTRHGEWRARAGRAQTRSAQSSVAARGGCRAPGDQAALDPKGLLNPQGKQP